MTGQSRTSTSKSAKGHFSGLDHGTLAGSPGYGVRPAGRVTPITGLYAALLPLFVYGVFGSSRQMAIGPVATDSLLVALTVGAVAQTGSNAYLLHTAVLTGMVGVDTADARHSGHGVRRKFLSRPVLSGFTSAAALIIGASQIRHVFRIPLPTTHNVAEVMTSAATNITAWHVLSMTLALMTILGLVIIKRITPRIPPGARCHRAGHGSNLGIWFADVGVRTMGEVRAACRDGAATRCTFGDRTRLCRGQTL